MQPNKQAALAEDSWQCWGPQTQCTHSKAEGQTTPGRGEKTCQTKGAKWGFTFPTGASQALDTPLSLTPCHIIAGWKDHGENAD